MANLAFLHGGNIYEVKRRYKKEVIDFSANINPLGLPPAIKRAIYNNFDKTLHYPDPDAKDITQKIAEYWNIKEENILISNGSVEPIYLITSICRPKSVLIPAPTFSEYERAARCIKSRIKFVKLTSNEGFKLDLTQLSYTDILFLCNPNNPTGNLIIENRGTVEKLPAKLVIVDEAFMDFLPDEKKHTLVWKTQKSKKIIVLRTFTKFFALPGLRIGYLVAHRDIVKVLRRHQIPWSVNTLAQLAAKMILDEETYMKKTQILIEKERSFLLKEIAKIDGLTPYPSLTNFLLIRIANNNITSSDLVKNLIQKDILIRDCANFRGLSNRYIRIAIRSRRENLTLLNAMSEVV